MIRGLLSLGRVLMRIAVLVFAAAVMASAPVLAQTTPTIPPTPTAGETTSAPPSESDTQALAAGNDGGEQICRTVQRTESRLRSRRERICMTRSQWEQQERDAAELTRGSGVQTRRD